IREASLFHCRVIPFTDSNLASALGSIRALSPRTVALDIGFAGTSEGRRFIDRLQSLAMTGLQVQLIAFANGRWSVTPIVASPGARVANAIVDSGVAAPVTMSGVRNTRRVPRFPVMKTLAAVVEGQATKVVD